MHTMSISIRAGLMGLLAATALVGCGKKQEAPPAADTAATPAGQAPASSEEKVVNVYNWSDYIDPKTLEQFTAETGIKVNYDVFDSNEVLETKLLAGNTGYDVVVPSASFMERQIKAGVFRKLDRSKIANWDKLDTEVLQRVALAIDANAPVDSWRLVLDPKEAAKYKDCGISVLDAPSEITAVALAYLGKDPNSQSEADLKLAEDLLMKVRPYIRMIHSSNYIDALANGEICIAIGWSGDVLQARDRAAEAGQGNVIKYNVPKEGTIIWFDMFAIPADAPHPQLGFARADHRGSPHGSGHLSAGRRQGEAVPRPRRVGRVHAPAEPHLDPLHHGQVTHASVVPAPRAALSAARVVSGAGFSTSVR
jgi:putrescine transport system substrate-binding protein